MKPPRTHRRSLARLAAACLVYLSPTPAAQSSRPLDEPELVVGAIRDLTAASKK
jgi:hypothetical protein